MLELSNKWHQVCQVSSRREKVRLGLPLLPQRAGIRDKQDPSAGPRHWISRASEAIPLHTGLDGVSYQRTSTWPVKPERDGSDREDFSLSNGPNRQRARLPAHQVRAQVVDSNEKGRGPPAIHLTRDQEPAMDRAQVDSLQRWPLNSSIGHHAILSFSTHRAGQVITTRIFHVLPREWLKLKTEDGKCWQELRAHGSPWLQVAHYIVHLH